jgi:hypothetical protein
MLSLGAVAADHYLPILVNGSIPWWSAVRSTSSTYNMISQLLSFTAILTGFLFSSRLYRYLNDVVVKDMISKAEETADRDGIRRALKMFVLVDGGSPVYQGACMLCTVLYFVWLHLFVIFPQWRQAAGLPYSLDITPFLGSWSRLLIYVLMTGVVGPMATAASGCAIFCGWVLTGKDVFDPLARDRRGASHQWRI